MDYLKLIFSDSNFIVTFFTFLIYIFIGYLCSRFGIATKKTKKVVDNILMKVCVPSLAFVGFMNAFDETTLYDGLKIILLTIIIYIVIFGLGLLIFIKKDIKKRLVYSLFFALGQVTLIGLPVAKTIYSGNLAEVLIPGNMVTFVFRFFLYIIAFSIVAGSSNESKNIGKTIKNILVNPIMISMIIGLIIWVTQNVLPKVTINNSEYSLFRIDKTLPVLYTYIKVMADLTTPLALGSIGITLGFSSLLSALKDKEAWLLAFLRSFVAPLITLVCAVICNSLHLINMSEATMATLVIMACSPLSAALSTFCSKYDNHVIEAARTTILSTLICLISIPLYTIIIKLLYLTIYA